MTRPPSPSTFFLRSPYRAFLVENGEELPRYVTSVTEKAPIDPPAVLRLRGGAPDTLVFTNKSEAKDCKDIMKIRRLPEEQMGRTFPPPQFPLRYRAGTTRWKMGVGDVRIQLEELGETLPEHEFDPIEEQPEEIPNWAREALPEQPMSAADFAADFAKQLSEPTLQPKEAWKDMFSTTERLQQKHYFPTSCRLGAATRIDRDDGSFTDSDFLRARFYKFHTKPLSIDWDCNKKVAQTLKEKERKKRKQKGRYRYSDKDFPGMYNELKNCLNPEEFRDCLSSLGFSVGQDEQGEINFQTILSIVDPADRRYMARPDIRNWETGYILVDRFLDFMRRPDLQTWGRRSLTTWRTCPEFRLEEEFEMLRSASMIKDGKHKTDLYRKPTDCNQYLLLSSSHRAHCTENIPFSQIFRICSEKIGD